MRPYYEHAGISICHGDCREILPTLPVADLLIADPPYGINYSHSGGGLLNGKPCRQGTAKVRVTGDDVAFDPAHLLSFPKLILWGANHYSDRLPASRGWMIWDKREATTTNSMSDCEMAWTNFLGTARLFHHLWNGLAKASEHGIERLHPTQKPVALMAWCIKFAPEARSVIDPYCGSGPTLEACKDLGLSAIGIEIEEKYCEIAAKRLSQEVLNFTEVL